MSTVNLPVYLRVGDGEEAQLGCIEIESAADLRPMLAGVLRAIADAVENPGEEVTDAAPR